MFDIIAPLDKVTPQFVNALQDKIDLKTKPQGSLGLLESIAFKVGLLQQTVEPVFSEPSVIIFAADHGIAEQGVSLFPQVVTEQMVLNFLQGGAAINCFSKQHDINLKIVNAGVKANFDHIQHEHFVNSPIALGTENFAQQPAMTQEQCLTAINKGADIVNQQHQLGCNVIGFGEMGIANTTSAAAIMAAILNLTGQECAGKGTGIDQQTVSLKAQVIDDAIKKYQLTEAEPLTVLQTVGGFEIAMMVGAMLKAAELSMLVLVDGFIASSAALVASEMHDDFLQYTQFCHQSDEQAHQLLLTSMSATPLLKLGMRLGEGSGVAVAYPLLVSALTFLNEMASFADAGVSDSQ
ncbi:nicotinate-nucleotide--dimethylbenzimidazole phosphoribosyltransferase [uncultured Psychromonas sp.]|uniref:nicotinate-nucleotide--dimethylbenzimidazole phosphoribosyltransferase n=1 Tax=uncultured Psychromonas sp. TaxID=173974 RepID=UPI0026357CD7|nr:nicotinate-nucleotide--dimethylbenzimidazole phosphoribosyltransferase [uncultured Psychromonas sp.]